MKWFILSALILNIVMVITMNSAINAFVAAILYPVALDVFKGDK